MSVVTIRLSRGALVMGPPGLLPPALIRASDTLTLRTVITNLPRDRTAMAQLRAGWRQFDPSTPVYLLTDAGLMTQMTRLLRGRRLLILYLPYQAGSFSRAELSGPPPGRDWSRADKADKVAEALRRSKDHVGPALHHMVEELVSPANIAIMVGFIVAVAIAHATGVAGAAIDVVLIGLAWAMAGYAGVKAIVDFIGAIIDVMDARTDAQIDAAARKFAEAFVALGAAFLARMLAKAKTGGTGTSAPKPKPKPEAKPKPRPVQGQQTAAQTPPQTKAPTRTPTKRPTWRQSEKDVGSNLGPGYSEQKSFIGGKEVPYGTKGSTRPDWFKTGQSVEVKNYNVGDAASRSRLVENVSNQAVQRAKDLPSGTVQSVYIDVRGQTLSVADANAVARSIATNSNGAISAGNVHFLRGP